MRNISKCLKEILAKKSNNQCMPYQGLLLQNDHEQKTNQDYFICV